MLQDTSLSTTLKPFVTSNLTSSIPIIQEPDGEVYYERQPDETIFWHELENSIRETMHYATESWNTFAESSGQTDQMYTQEEFEAILQNHWNYMNGYDFP